MATIYDQGRQPDILLIDDNQGDARLFQIAFKKTPSQAPPRVAVAETGEKAIDLLQAKEFAAPGGHPDIIFLDLNLPSMHGLRFLEIVKNDPVLTPIPVLVLSSSSAVRDIDNCYRRHANGFLTKPGSFDGYLEMAELISAHWFNLVHMPPIMPLKHANF